ncbi:MAG: hypothetical protein V7752_02505 [Halopseudomonas sp.]
MKAINKAVLATVASAIVLTAGVAQATTPSFGYKPVGIDYTNSFNNTNKFKTKVDNSKRFESNTDLKYNRDNSVRNRLSNDYKLDLRYDYRQDNLNANQNLNQLRGYSSGVGQNAGNVGNATGHSMKQKQGDTSVGSLVSETNTSKHKGHNLLSPTYSSHYGSSNSGNMMQSHIGGVQSGMQGGNVTNLQGNDQQQDATSFVSSDDTVSNSASK